MRQPIQHQAVEPSVTGPTDMTWDDQIGDTSMGRPHLVILGAGASRAAFPQGDRNGHLLPLMNDLVDVVGLGPLLEAHGLSPNVEDFEALYSEIATNTADPKLRADLEEAIRDYFTSLELPDHPTLYDLLLLALREKDMIATFNWDPFLWDAWVRNRNRATTPRLAFLHGSVRVGYCEAHRRKGPRWAQCSECREPFTPSPLLYPVAQKDYAADPFLAGEWGGTQSRLSGAWMVTVFGYGVPRTDVEAIRLFSKAWGELADRNFEEFEFIDLADAETLRSRWKGFVFESHFRTSDKFEDSWLARHPRRSGEAMWAQLIDARWVHDAEGYADVRDFDSLDEWLAPLLQAEGQASEA